MRMWLGASAILWVNTAAWAESEIREMLGSASLTLQENPVPPAENRAAEPDPHGDAESTPARKAFGDPGSWYWSVGGGAAFTDNDQDYQGYLQFGTFLAEQFEINFGISGWYHDQDGEEAQSANPAFGFRYHFLPKRTVDPYLEAGIGLLFSTDDVPSDGTSFNFTPRAGAGVLIKLGESETRLDLGVRWHHISNASIDGGDDNPARDSIMVYAGVVVPF